MGRALAALVALGLALPACAGAWSVGENVSVGIATLAADHPCRAGVEVRWTPGLRVDGAPAAGGSVTGVRNAATGAWGELDARGAWEPMRCLSQLEPAEYASLSACGQRRLVVHEVMRLGGHRTEEGGIMALSPRVRARVAVPGCRPARAFGCVPRRRARRHRARRGAAFDSRAGRCR
jgi:hypothetical protein